MNKQSQKS